VSSAETFEAVLALRPELADGHARLTALVGDGRVDPALLALCRRRMGSLLGCDVHGGPTPPWSELSATGAACLDFAERFVLDVHGIDDGLAARVVDGLGPGGMVAFTTALAVFDGACRFERTIVQRAKEV